MNNKTIIILFSNKLFLFSGLPHRSSDRHATEIANFSLKMLNTVTEMKFCNGHRTIKLRIGIHTGNFCTHTYLNCHNTITGSKLYSWFYLLLSKVLKVYTVFFLKTIVHHTLMIGLHPCFLIWHPSNTYVCNTVHVIYNFATSILRVTYFPIAIKVYEIILKQLTLKFVPSNLVIESSSIILELTWKKE